MNARFMAEVQSQQQQQRQRIEALQRENERLRYVLYVELAASSLRC